MSKHNIFKNLPVNTRVQVSPDAPFHAGRIGYFQFYGGPNHDVAVCTADQTESGSTTGEYFAVNPFNIWTV